MQLPLPAIAPRPSRMPAAAAVRASPSPTAARTSLWRAGAALLIWWAATAAGNAQTGSEASYTDMMLALCRQYAAAQAGMPRDVMFQQCMAQRHCWVSAGAAAYQCEAPGPMSWHGGGY